MKILGIDTSCDDTCIAIIGANSKQQTTPKESDETSDPTGRTNNSRKLIVDSCKSRFKILSNIVSSQIKVHQEYGGVYPSLAKREHQHNLVLVLKQSLMKAGLLKSKIKNKEPKTKIRKLKKILEREPTLAKNLTEFLKEYNPPKIDAIAVTVGPGLEPCLWQGVNFAKALSFFWKKLIVPVNHIEAHILANWLQLICLNFQFSIFNFQKFFPAVCLVVSGGHTELILMKNYGRYKLLGETRDDAAGECLDKVARILGLSYPGGPAIAKQVRQWKSQIQNKSIIQHPSSNIQLPRPMIHQKNYDFSFSGLKTAVLYDFKKRTKKTKTSKKYIQKMCAEIQQAIIDVLIKKTKKAAEEFKTKIILIGGGVAANEELRKQFNSQITTGNRQLKFLAPPKILCTDNAAMVSVAGYFGWLQEKQKNWKKIEANANLKIVNRQ